MARTFTLIMECDNAAFEDDINAEAARILRRVADDIEARGIATPLQLLDANGNSVGEADFNEGA